jgi:hypothetical protein
MIPDVTNSYRKPYLPRYIARAVALLWGAWWTFFGIASTIDSSTPQQILTASAIIIPLFMGSVLIPWKWEKPGGALLMLEGFAIFIAYARISSRPVLPSTAVFVLGLMALPLLLCGLTFLLSPPQE